MTTGEEKDPAFAELRAAFAASKNPVEFRDELARRGFTLAREHRGEPIVAVRGDWPYPLPDDAQRRAAVALSGDPIPDLIDGLLEVSDNAKDVRYELDRRDIFLVRPTLEECQTHGLVFGEIYAVAETGIYGLDRDKFNAREQARHGQWDEDIQAIYEARDFDRFMKRAYPLDSLAEAQALLAEPPDLPGLVEEAFAVSLTPQQFVEELGERGMSLRVYRDPEEHYYADGQIIAVHAASDLLDYPLPPAIERWAALVVKPDPNLTALHQAFQAEHGAEFSARLKQDHIFLARPTPEECRDNDLPVGELVAVAEDRSFLETLFVDLYSVRKEFDAAEQALDGKRIEKNQARYCYTARDFDTFIEGADSFGSIAEVRADIERRRGPERAAERERVERAQARAKELREANQVRGRDHGRER